MTKTIETRAIYAAIADTNKGRKREDYFITAMADHENGFREGYISGATEQRKIDVEKACKEFLHFLNIRVDNKNYQLRREDFTNWVNDFRKAMEE